MAVEESRVLLMDTEDLERYFDDLVEEKLEKLIGKNLI